MPDVRMPSGIVTAPNSSNVQSGEPYWSMTAIADAIKRAESNVLQPLARNAKASEEKGQCFRATVNRRGIELTKAAGIKQPRIGPATRRAKDTQWHWRNVIAAAEIRKRIQHITRFTVPPEDKAPY